MGRDQRGVGPWPLPRIPTSCPISLLPIPLCGLPLRSDRGGWGGKDGSGDHCREVTGKCRPLPIPQKDDCSGDGKGAVVSWTTRPKFLYAALHDAMHATAGAAKALKPKPRNGSIRPKQERGKGQRQRGFGVWMRAGHTHIQHSPSATAKNPKTSTSTECIGTNSWDRMASIKSAKSSKEVWAKSLRDRCKIDMCENESDNTSAEAKLKLGHVKWG